MVQNPIVKRNETKFSSTDMLRAKTYASRVHRFALALCCLSLILAPRAI